MYILFIQQLCIYILWSTQSADSGKYPQTCPDKCITTHKRTKSRTHTTHTLHTHSHTHRQASTQGVISCGKYSIWRASTNPWGVADVYACFRVFIAAHTHYSTDNHTPIHTHTFTAELGRSWGSEWETGRGMRGETMKTKAVEALGGDVSLHYLWLLLLYKWRPVTMQLTGDCNPGDSLGLVTMETSNQEKMLAIFPYN